ncbi:MAG: hypothetical protein FH749_07305 [Firmicutes bacterium]|nr:hypothetical protein [Bacillota bacterium]
MQFVNPKAGKNIKSRLRQFFEQIYIAAWFQITPSQYKLYRFYKQDVDMQKVREYMSRWAYFTYVQPALNHPNWAILLKNKWFFHAHYSKFDNVPLTNVFGYYHPHFGFAKGGAGLRTAEDLHRLLANKKPKGIVLKPVSGFQGKGVLIIDKIIYGEELSFVTNKDTNLSLGELMDYMNCGPVDKYIDEGFLIEEKLVQHPFFEDINPHHANTMRVVTFIDKDNKPNIHFAMLRLGRKGSPTDNWQWGNIAVQIDQTTGVMGKGLHPPDYSLEYVTKHPDTGVTFTGKQIPMWDEILDACKAIALATPNSRAIGWDVGLTAEGPVIIEGNRNYDMTWPQAYGSGYLQPEIAQQLAQFGLEFTPGLKLKFLLDLLPGRK